MDNLSNESLDSTNEELLEANQDVEHDDTREGEDAPSELGDDSSGDDPRDARIKELEEKLKEKSIKERLKAKKTTKENKGQEVISSDIEQRLVQAELKAEGIKHSEDIKTVVEAAKVMGIDPVEALSSPVVSNILAENQKKRTADLAVPSTSRRKTADVRGNADYWIKKGELPPKEETQLRREVVNKKLEQAKHKQMFNN